MLNTIIVYTNRRKKINVKIFFKEAVVFLFDIWYNAEEMKILSRLWGNLIAFVDKHFKTYYYI